MRLKKDIVDLDYSKIKNFFNNRAQKYRQDNPYTVTMYQDNNPEIVIKRNKIEVQKILPLLNLNSKSIVLDIACGIGRWGDAIKENTTIDSYYGIDFSSELITLAKSRNIYDNFFYFTGDTNEIIKILHNNNCHKPDRIIIAGLLMYLSDKDILSLLCSLTDIIQENAIIYIREPIGLENRLTLKDFYSDELMCEYNAIYRTREEYYHALAETLLPTKFSIVREGFLFEQSDLNNRKETEQYFFLLSRPCTSGPE